MPHDPRSPFIFVDGVGHTASGDQVMSNFDAVWTGLDTAIAGVAASIDAPVQTPVLTARQVRDVGEANQVRAGRVLALADFTRIGLAAPVGLWNLGDLTDVSGNARSLTNKGTVTFGAGIAGAATEAAIFTGSTAQALYIVDTGAADPFRIKTGSWGCWMRTAKRGTQQYLMAKFTAAAFSFGMSVTTANVVNVAVSLDGTTNLLATGTVDIADDRWHFVVGTHDGTRARVYVDGALDAVVVAAGPLAGVAAPLDIGGRSADAAIAAADPHFGRIDEAFVTSDVLSPEQVLNLYCARVTQPLGVPPTGMVVNVTRRRRGGALSTGDFPSSPVRLHNFTAGVLTDAGTGGVTLAPVGGGTIVSVAAADGTRDGAYSFSGAHTGLGSTDTGLPATTTSRSYGIWFKVGSTAAISTLMSWGSGASSANGVWLGLAGTANAQLFAQSGAAGTDITGPFVADGLWHHVIVVEDNAAGDLLKRKMYLDGRLVGSTTTLASITLGGANKFRVGAGSDGAVPFVGQLDSAFVFAGVLTPEQVRAVYNVGAQALAASPKAEGDHVDAMEASGVLVHFDTLEGCDLVDMSVVG